MTEHNLKKTDSAVSCVRYLFDPDERRITKAVITVREESMLPEFGKVLHISGKRYAVYFEGEDKFAKFRSARRLFKHFYLQKLANATEEVSKFASILTYFQ